MEEEGKYEPIFVARQPIFDRKGGIYAYELLFRHGAGATTAEIEDGDKATAQVIADGSALAMRNLRKGRKIFVNFPAKLIERGSAFALPTEVSVIELLETIRPDAGIVTACKNLKRAGYTLALDDFIGQAGFEPFLKLADIVKVDVLNLTDPELMALVGKLRPYKCKLLAEKVEDKKRYEFTKSIGFEYFQGYYFSKPEIIEGRKIPVGDLTKLQLLKELPNPDYEVDKVAQIISADLSLSYRLLQYLNSVSISLRYKVQSIRQAVTILGSNPLKQWLMVVMISDMGSSSKAEDLAFRSVQRGKYLELLSKFFKQPPYPNDTMFLIGLFSKLDAILDQEMDNILDQVPLDDEIKAALVGEKNKARDWIDLTDAIESGNWKNVGKILKKYKLDPKEAAVRYTEATDWADEILGSAQKKAA